jgi:glutathione S-transferase
MFGAKAEIAAREKGIDFDLVMVPFDMARLYDPKHPRSLMRQRYHGVIAMRREHLVRAV